MRSAVSRCLWGLPLLLLGVAGPVDADWPQFRGPTGEGHAAGNLPLTWSAAENVAWKTPVEGLSWSSPVVHEGRIYLTTAVEQAGDAVSLQALALDAATGKELWQQEVFQQQGKVQIHQKNSHASPTPVVEGDRLYVHFGPHGTACVSAVDGKPLWKTKLDYKPTHGTGGSPALFGDRLIICCDGSDVQYVVALDSASGDELWRTPRDTSPGKGFSFSTPLKIEVSGRVQAICPGSSAVFAYDPHNGQEIWRVRYGDGYSVVPRPVYSNGLVYVCTGYNRPRLLAIDPSGRGDVTDSHVKWEADRGIPHNPSPVAVGDAIYCVSDKGIAVCLDALTGEERWQQRLGGNFSASPLATEDRIYFQDENGTAYVVAAEPEYRLLAENAWAPGQRTYASYAVDGSDLLLRSESELLRVKGAPKPVN
jgi:outer membrane protein assembly factor BamB